MPLQFMKAENLHFSDLVKQSHGQHRQGCVYNVVQSDEELIVHRLHRPDMDINKEKWW